MSSSLSVCQLPFLNQQIDCVGLMTSQPLWVILCCLPEKGTKEIEETEEEKKESDREEREQE